MGFFKGRWCSDTGKRIVCKRKAIGKSETFVIQKASHGWISLKSAKTNKYCLDYGNRISCDSNSVGTNSSFLEVNLGPEWEAIGFFGLKGQKHNRWCSDEARGISCSFSSLLDHEIFAMRVVKKG